jgi:hypothetical protein
VLRVRGLGFGVRGSGRGEGDLRSERVRGQGDPRTAEFVRWSLLMGSNVIGIQTIAELGFRIVDWGRSERSGLAVGDFCILHLVNGDW